MSDDSIVGFGQHKVLTYKALLAKDPGYCSWVVSQAKASKSEMIALRGYLIAHDVPSNAKKATAADSTSTTLPSSGTLADEITALTAAIMSLRVEVATINTKVDSITKDLKITECIPAVKRATSPKRG